MSPRLHEAILLGSLGTEQGYGATAMYGEATCAMGAALAAVGIRVLSNLEGLNEITRLWSWTNRRVPVPCCLIPHMAPDLDEPVYSIIWRLNDTAKWTRPQIAAWVVSVEPQDAMMDIEQPRQETNV